MADTPTKKPESGMTKQVHTSDGLGPAPLKVISQIKQTAPGIVKVPMPAKPKVSIEKDNAKLEAKFNSRGAAKPWKPKGGRAKSRGSSDVKMRPVSKRVGDASMGISLKKGYKVI